VTAFSGDFINTGYCKIGTFLNQFFRINTLFIQKFPSAVLVKLQKCFHNDSSFRVCRLDFHAVSYSGEIIKFAVYSDKTNFFFAVPKNSPKRILLTLI